MGKALDRAVEVIYAPAAIKKVCPPLLNLPAIRILGSSSLLFLLPVLLLLHGRDLGVLDGGWRGMCGWEPVAPARHWKGRGCLGNVSHPFPCEWVDGPGTRPPWGLPNSRPCSYRFIDPETPVITGAVLLPSCRSLRGRLRGEWGNGLTKRSAGRSVTPRDARRPVNGIGDSV
jgi:hypothetical protein